METRGKEQVLQSSAKMEARSMLEIGAKAHYTISRWYQKTIS